MDATREIVVTLSDDLWNHLRKEAKELHIPLRWLVAGLVCDTLETKPRSAGCSNRTILRAS
jgi:hypothetical protein